MRGSCATGIVLMVAAAHVAAVSILLGPRHVGCLMSATLSATLIWGGVFVLIMVTLEDTEGVRAAAKAAGADDFVAKVPEVVDALRAAIGRAFPGVEVRPCK